MGNAMGELNDGVLGAGGEEQQPADRNPLIFWECRRCKPRLGPGNYHLDFIEGHRKKHEKEDEQEQRARDEARQREAAKVTAAKQGRSWMGRRKKY